MKPRAVVLKWCAGVQGSTDGPLAASALAGPDSHATGPMSSSQLAAGSALRTLIGQKEKELHDMNEYRIQVGVPQVPSNFLRCLRSCAVDVSVICLCDLVALAGAGRRHCRA